MASIKPIDHTLFELALDLVEPFQFERFGQAFYASVEGKDFIPLGGVKDGGADGLMPDVFEETSGSRILQISKSADHRPKIRQTVARLREYGRTVKGLTYLTSIAVQNTDTEEDHLSDQLGVPIRIRDKRYIVAHINDSAKSIQAGLSYILPSVTFLNRIGSSPIIPDTTDLPARSLSVFLSQELERRRGNTDLLVSVTDSLILWSLENTDPAADQFATKAEVLSSISKAVPAAIPFIRQNLQNRLEYLTRKDNTTGRQIQYHKSKDAYCLPYETRLKVTEENLLDSVLKANVTEQFRIRLATIAPLLSRGTSIDLVSEACHFAITSVFKEKGLELCSFVHGSRNFDVCPTLDRYVYEYFDRNTNLAGLQFSMLRGATLEVLRQSLYESVDCERMYYQKLSRTYALMFTMRNEPQIIEYFSKMTGNFALYVGSDILVRALSEHYLDPKDQMTRNLLAILRTSGSKLILSEKTLGEVIGNIRKTRNAWEHEYRRIDRNIDIHIAQQVPMILLRAYYYAKLSPVRADMSAPKGFTEFVGQFLTYSNTRNEEGVEELRDYLCSAFKLDFETSDEMLHDIDIAELNELTAKIVGARPRGENEEVLARNDALQVLRVYKRREILRERSANNPFGFRTWWLTQESALLKATEALEISKRSRFLIRPEFLLNYISLAPSLAKVRESFNHIFPTVLGVRLSNRMSEKDFEKIIDDANVMLDVDESRASVMMSRLSDRLKSDRSRKYEVDFEALDCSEV